MITAHFNSIYPELKSRLNCLSRHFHEPEEAFSEMLASCWRNLLSKFQRTGILLSASALAFIAHKRHASGRVISGYSNCDVLADNTFRSGRVRVVSFAQMTTTNKAHALDDSTVKRITAALSLSERESPANLAAVRIDWRELCRRLDPRLRRIVEGLSVGEKKAKLAKQLKISAGRLSQLLVDLAKAIVEFFGWSNLPDNLELFG